MKDPMTKAITILAPAPQRVDTDTLPLLDPMTYEGPRFMEVFAHAVSRARSFGTTTEAMFVSWLANRLPVTLIDGAGNLHVDLRTRPEHRSMFTAHTDTARFGGGVNPVRIDGNIWRADKNSCLGADDAAGIAVLYNMIINNVPGYYVFFRGEECGGLGSSWVAAEMPELFVNIDRAIAFDRAGYSDVITHQRGGRCCSDEFAHALADALTTETEWFMPDATGVYTDTAEFTHIIPECTNVSVGYKHQHGDREEQDIQFLQILAEIVLTVPWDDLPVVRNPKVHEMRSMSSASRMYALDDDVVVGTPGHGMDPRDLDDYDLDFAYALEDALYNDKFDDLIQMIADDASPEMPELAMNHIRKSLLTEKLLAETLQAIDWGIDTETLLSSLADACIVP